MDNRVRLNIGGHGRGLVDIRPVEEARVALGDNVIGHERQLVVLEAPAVPVATHHALTLSLQTTTPAVHRVLLYMH
jgi:hypothetical protein